MLTTKKGRWPLRIFFFFLHIYFPSSQYGFESSWWGCYRKFIFVIFFSPAAIIVYTATIQLKWPEIKWITRDTRRWKHCPMWKNERQKMNCKKAGQIASLVRRYPVFCTFHCSFYLFILKPSRGKVNIFIFYHVPGDKYLSSNLYIQ